jgi:drug/metabolite transporter (DMT)-like permease
MTHDMEVIGIPALSISGTTTVPRLVNPWTPLVVATFGWACSAVLSKAVLNRGVDTFTLVPVRLAFAMVTLLALIAVTRRFWTTSRAAWGRGAMLGVVAMGIPNVILTRALEDLPVSLGGLLLALIPITTVVAAHFLLDNERFRAGSIPGLLIAFIGCGVLVGVGGESIEGVGNLWRGVALSLTGVTLAGIGGALTRRYALEVKTEDLVLPQFAVGTLILFVVVPPVFGLDLGSIDPGSLGLIAVIGVVGTTLPFTAFIIAAAINPAWRLGLTGYTVPALAVALAIVLLGERLTPSIIGGAVLILGGVILADRANRGTSEVIVPI